MSNAPIWVIFRNSVAFAMYTHCNIGFYNYSGNRETNKCKFFTVHVFTLKLELVSIYISTRYHQKLPNQDTW